MAWPKEQKQQTQQKVIEVACRLFSVHGYENVSIEEVMAQAKLTHGGFYNLFSSKAALYREAIHSAIQQGRKFFAQFDGHTLDDFIMYYLSDEHCFSTTYRCPLSSVTSDVIRSDMAIRHAYNQSFNAFVNGIQQKSASQPSSINQQQKPLSRTQALQVAVSLIGSMTLARSVDDKDSATEILAAGQKNALQILQQAR